MRAEIRSRSTTRGTLVMQWDANGQKLNLMTMHVRRADFDLDPIPTGIIMSLVNADYPTIRCAACPDNEKVVFISPEYLRLWLLELAQACVTRLDFTILRRRHQALAAQLLVVTVIRWPQYLPRRRPDRPTLIALAWDGRRGPHTRLGLRQTRDLRGPSGTWVKH